MLSQETLAAIVQRVVEVTQPEKIILFGSAEGLKMHIEFSTLPARVAAIGTIIRFEQENRNAPRNHRLR